MNDSRLLYDAFTIYYDCGMEALKEENYEVAKRNILEAAETLLKLAKESSGQLKAQRIKRSEELTELASKIECREKSKSCSSQAVGEESRLDVKEPCEEAINETPVKNNSLEAVLKELNGMEGLKTVKQQVSDLADQIAVFQKRKEEGLPVPEMSYHMVFTGNPGTGKTTVARIVGKLYQALGILSKGHLVEVDRSDLVAGYVGQTALKTKDVISKAMGGILFIDEAYSLKKEGNDFGQEAIDTLNKAMEDSRNDFVVIVAGYKEEMKSFIESNQGLRSRFRTFINFEDYSGDELYKIFLDLLKKKQYVLTDEADKQISVYLKNRDINEFTGNARDVRNLFENIVNLQARRIARINTPTKNDLVTITVEDLPFPPLDAKTIETAEKSDDHPNLASEGESKNCVLKAKERSESNDDFHFEWDVLPMVKFDDISGLEYAKEVVRTKVLLPLEQPEALAGYVKKNGGGLFLYGPPGTGKTMLAAAIANEIGAKFCSVKPSDLLYQGAGNTEKAVRALFSQAKQYPCAVICFDEFDSIAQKNTKSTYSRQLRSELLSQMQGIESYGKENGNLLFLIAMTNRPWDVDGAFLRPGRFGTLLYVGLPEDETRKNIVLARFDKLKANGVVKIYDDVNVETLVEKTNGFNGSDITNLLDRIEEISILRGAKSGAKFICQSDLDEALSEIHFSVQLDDIKKLVEWKDQNNNL